MPPYVLMVAADVYARQAEMEALEAAGIEVRATASIDGALASVAQRRPALVVLDLHLRHACGLDLCRDLWRTGLTPRLPVMVLGGRDDAAHRIVALEMGVDDFQSLPVPPRELALRVQAILRRTVARHPSRPAAAERLVIGPLTVVPGGAEALLLGRPVSLTSTEFRLLLALARSGDRIRSRAELVAVVWGRAGGHLRHRLDVHVRRLRAKLGGPGSPIETVRGRGYRLRPETA